MTQAKDSTTGTTHTPGPWTISEREDREGRRHIQQDGFALAIVCARASSPASGPQYFEKDANAHLIAAAPDLYEAIKGSMQYLDMTIGPCDEGCECILHGLHAAIAKAEGRS